MPKATHIIRNTTVNFHFNGNTEGFALQREVHDWFDDLVTDLDKELSSLEYNRNIISVDRIQLEVNLNNGDWHQEASAKIIAQLTDKMRLMKAGVVERAGYEEQGQLQRFKESFIYFLDQGFLPWHTSHISTTQWHNAAAEMLEKPDRRFLQRVKKTLKYSSVAQARFSQTVSLKKALDVFLSDTLQKDDEHQRLISDLQLLDAQILLGASIDVSKDIYEVLFLSLADTADLLSAKKRLLASFQINRDINFIPKLKALPFASQVLKNLQKELAIAVKKKRVEKVDRTSQWQQMIDKEKVSTLQQVNNHFFKEPIFISNAGLVIVAAFLPTLFERGHLVTEQKITDINTAVCLINYLATGDEKMEEYELVLPKILCGISPAMLIHTNVIFSNKIKQEAAALLHSITEHWTILKDTSSAGLQETFLQRSGKVSYKNNEWLLQVEQKQFDMLLEHLPWNTSMIKLAWMPYMLKTEWM